MKEYTVYITDEAYEDMENIYNHIAYVLRSPENAMNQYDRIADEILKLNELPYRFPEEDREPEHSRGIRKMVVDNYKVRYYVDEELDRVTVTNVLYSAMNK